jgi:hypothetical protein
MTQKIKRYYSDIEEVIDIVFDSDLDGTRGMRSCDADRVVGIIGSEGSGKSNLSLYFLEKWFTKLKRQFSEENIKYVCSNEQDFAEILSDDEFKKYDMVSLDEAVLMSYSRTGLSAMNVNTNKFLMTCRGLNAYFLILCPNLLDLDSYLRKTRLSAVWIILPKHRVAYFSRKRLRMLLPRMADASRSGNYPDPMKCGIRPNFVAGFKKYEGVIAKAYAERKRKGMDIVKKTLIESIKNFDKNKPKEPKMMNENSLVAKVKRGMEQNLSPQEMAKLYGANLASVYNTRNRLKKALKHFNQ